MSISLRVSLLSTSASNHLNGQESTKSHRPVVCGFRGSGDLWGKAKCREECPLKLMFVMKNRILY